jgi:hypothetical protein
MAAEIEIVNVSTRAGNLPVATESRHTRYVALAAGSTTIISSTGAYLDRLVVIPASTGAGAVTLSDGTTAIMAIPAAAHAVDPHPYTVSLGLRGVGGAGFKLVLGASVSALAVGEQLSATTA